MTDRLTYREAGVDADRADALVDRIAHLAKKTHRAGLVSGVGGFASLFSLKDALGGTLRDPLLVSGTDGVGTKLKIAFLSGRHDTVGIDLVAMCVNDVLTTGATPLFFLDYFATGRLDVGVAEAVIRGIAEGCHRAECALVGGETAELPGFYADGEYDLAGFSVGVVERSELIDGRMVTAGDVLIGISSRGLHSNGYSLARKALLERGGLALDARVPGLDRPIVDELLEPTAIYTRAVRELRASVPVKALSHITGGGLPGNVPRVLPAGVVAAIDVRSFPRPPIFDVIRERGNVSEDEMFRTFNMGLGLVVVVGQEHQAAALRALEAGGERATVIGSIRAGSPGAEAEVALEGL